MVAVIFEVVFHASFSGVVGSVSVFWDVRDERDFFVDGEENFLVIWFESVSTIAFG